MNTSHISLSAKGVGKAPIIWLALALFSVCAFGHAQDADAACATTRVYLLLDTSGSMKGTKHSDVRSSIKSLTTNHHNKLEFGLATFGSTYNHRVNISSTGWQSINSSIDSFPSNENYTRMGTAIRAAGQYIWGIKQTEPTATKNRPYYLVLITDGYPTGESLSATTETRKLWQSYGIKTFVIGIQFNATLLNNIAKEGQTTKAYSATNQANLNTAFNSIANQASAEVCDGLDNDCNGQVDENLTRTCSNSCGNGSQQCVSGSWTACSSSQNAKPEECDGLDNDCDGKADENWPDKGKACSVGRGACKRSSTWQCRPDKGGIHCPVQPGPPGTETCNARDDDCDGRVDGLTRNCSTACGSGTQFCLIAFWGSCSAKSPQPEQCNGLDDNCDGNIDEDWPLKNTQCSQGGGPCANVGLWKCNTAGTGLSCAANSPNGKPEQCNGLDDDCDGNIDEDWPTKGNACGSGTGSCNQRGKLVCSPNGSGLQCSSSGGTPKPEVCDSIDNDCDGSVDEMLTRPCKSGCGQGTETCQSGKWVGCTAPKATPETCDARDNDCDGVIDNGLRRTCKGKCGDGLETCVAGKWAYCDAQTPKTEVCDTKDNDCNGKIDDIPPKPCQATCGQGESTCDKGVWSECKGTPPSPETCDGKDNDCDGTIDEELTQACKSKCGDGNETCRNGKWEGCDAQQPALDICDGNDNDCDGKTDNGAKCPAGSVCQFGRCFLKCRNGECPNGSFCESDLCNGNLCEKVKCDAGKACVVGRCVELCELGTCPTGTLCKNGQCIDPNNPGSEQGDPDGSVNNEPQSSDSNTDGGSSADKGNQGSDDPTSGIDDIGTTDTVSLETKTGGIDNSDPGNGRPRGTGCICGPSEGELPPTTLLFLALFLLAFSRIRRKGKDQA